jgi:hypothetical protein
VGAGNAGGRIFEAQWVRSAKREMGSFGFLTWMGEDGMGVGVFPLPALPHRVGWIRGLAGYGVGRKGNIDRKLRSTRSGPGKFGGNEWLEPSGLVLVKR